MTKFVVVEESNRYVIRSADPIDEWDRDDTAANISVVGVRIADSYFDTALPSEYDPSKPIYLVWADYDTGDSFGRDYNQFEAIDLFQDEAIAIKARNDLLEGSGYTRTYTRDDGRKIKYHCPWEGYFESLNCIHVQEVKIVY